MAKSIQTVCRRTDVVARYGGEEMAVILPETDASKAALVAERIRSMIEHALIQVDGQVLRVTASVGFACLDDHIANPESLIKLADGALYESKSKGRNLVTQGVSRFELSKPLFPTKYRS